MYRCTPPPTNTTQSQAYRPTHHFENNNGNETSSRWVGSLIRNLPVVDGTNDLVTLCKLFGNTVVPVIFRCSCTIYTSGAAALYTDLRFVANRWRLQSALLNATLLLPCSKPRSELCGLKWQASMKKQDGHREAHKELNRKFKNAPEAKVYCTGVLYRCIVQVYCTGACFTQMALYGVLILKGSYLTCFLWGVGGFRKIRVREIGLKWWSSGRLQDLAPNTHRRDVHGDAGYPDDGTKWWGRSKWINRCVNEKSKGTSE